MKRRALLKLAPAALALGSAPAISGEVLARANETPVMRVYREYVAYREWVNTTVFEDDDLAAATDGLDDHLNIIVSTPSQGPADTAIKFFAVVEDYDALHENPFREDLEAEARALIGGAA